MRVSRSSWRRARLLTGRLVSIGGAAVLLLAALGGCGPSANSGMPVVEDAVYEKVTDGMTIEEVKALVPGAQVVKGATGEDWVQAQGDGVLYSFRFHEGRVVEKVRKEAVR